jgi:hypothetical protein
MVQAVPAEPPVPARPVSAAGLRSPSRRLQPLTSTVSPSFFKFDFSEVRLPAQGISASVGRDFEERFVAIDRRRSSATQPYLQIRHLRHYSISSHDIYSCRLALYKLVSCLVFVLCKF